MDELRARQAPCSAEAEQAVLGAMLIVVGNYMPKARQNYTIGIRIPWTLANEENVEAADIFMVAMKNNFQVGQIIIDWILAGEF